LTASVAAAPPTTEKVAAWNLAEGKGPAGQGAKASKPRSLRSAARGAGRAAARPRAADLLALVEFYRWTVPFASRDRTAVDRAREADAAAKTARSAYLLAQLDPDQNTSRTALLDAAVAGAGGGQAAGRRCWRRCWSSCRCATSRSGWPRGRASCSTRRRAPPRTT
jgi:hypothetical protein